jgi:hypothetical protein
MDGDGPLSHGVMAGDVLDVMVLMFSIKLQLILFSLELVRKAQSYCR